MTLLQVDDLAVRYGPVQAVRDATFSVGESELVVIVGANGAGKTSMLRALSGLVRSRGAITFGGERIDRLPGERRVRAGLVQVPEGRHILGRMSVLENLRIAAWGTRRGRRAELPEIYGLFPVLEARRHQQAGTLSGGEQQMLALARALIRRPRLLILDEPSMGLAPLIVEQVFSVIADIHRAGTSVLLVEQNARMALSIADRGYVMEAGRLSGGGPAAAMLDDEALRAAYFGGGS